MKGTSVLRFASWPKIHQPLPRNPRQSQQLLNALTSSFRRQLDREHPSSNSPSEQHYNGDSLPENLYSSMHATDKHMQSILNNPLFRVKPTRSSVQLDEHRLGTEPMALFDDLVASGSVTTLTLRSCLQSQLWLASRHTGDGYLKAMKESRAGSRFVDWWLASGSYALPKLFKSRTATRTMTKFMMAEGLKPTVMGWLDLLAKNDVGGRARLPLSVVSELYQIILYEMVAWELNNGGGLLTALQSFVPAAKGLLDKGEQGFHHRALHTALQTAASTLYNAIRKRSTKIPVAVFEDFVKIQEQVWPMTRKTVVLHLHHPTQADPTPFLLYAKQIPPGLLGKLSGNKQAAFMRSGLEVLEVLMDQDRAQDASDLAQIMQQSLPAIKDQKAVQKAFRSPVVEHFLTRVNLAIT